MIRGWKRGKAPIAPPAYGKPAEPSEENGEEDGRTYEPHEEGPTSQQVRAAYALQATYQKDHIAAALFAIFLGMFGMHKFYLGYNQTAFIMLSVTVVGGLFSIGLAALVMWVVSIIEGIIYLTKSQTEFDQRYVLNKREWF